jgi:chemotaxis protein CheX
MEAINHDNLVQVVHTATQEVFTTMLGMELSCLTPYLEKVPPVPAEGVVSLIGLAGRWVGTGCVCCSAALACRICSQMLMVETDSVGEDVLDAIAEVTNMIVGNVKTVLEEQLGPMGLSIPTVVFGKNFTTRSSGDGEWTVFPFLWGEQRLEVKICLAPSRKPALAVRPGFPHACSIQG